MKHTFVLVVDDAEGTQHSVVEKFLLDAADDSAEKASWSENCC